MSAAAAGPVKVASVNWDYGGIGQDGSTARWAQTIEALLQVRPQVVLCQELGVPQPGLHLARHVRRTANALGMEPVLGPVVPGARSALHIAILIDTRSTGWRIDDEGPYQGRGCGGPARAWCMAELGIAGVPRPLQLFSAHFPARSAVAQLAQAQNLAALAAGQLALIGGDFNSFARGGPAISSGELDALPPALRVSRCRTGADGQLEPDFSADDVLTRRAGLADIAALRWQVHRDPAGLAPTGRGGARIDRFYGSPALAAAAASYRQFPIGSDHQAVLLDLDLTKVTQ